MPIATPSPPWFELALSTLATWRLAHLIAREDGPFDLIVRLRLHAGEGLIGRLMDCPYCLSLWIAIPFGITLAQSPWRTVLLTLAISGGSSLLERATETTPSTSGDR